MQLNYKRHYEIAWFVDSLYTTSNFLSSSSLAAKPLLKQAPTFSLQFRAESGTERGRSSRDLQRHDLSGQLQYSSICSLDEWLMQDAGNETKLLFSVDEMVISAPRSNPASQFHSAYIQIRRRRAAMRAAVDRKPFAVSDRHIFR